MARRIAGLAKNSRRRPCVSWRQAAGTARNCRGSRDAFDAAAMDRRAREA